MNDKDQPIAAAQRPHRQNDDSANTKNPNTDDKQSSDRKLSFWGKIRAKLAFRAPTLRQDLQEALEDSTANGFDAAFSDGERALIQNVLNLSQIRVEDVMVNRADIEATEVDDSVAVLIARFREAGHSRLPVYDDTLDNIVGMVHIKDLLLSLSEPQETKDKKAHPEKLKTGTLRAKLANAALVREVLYVPPAMPVGNLLQSMQATRIHMAIVVDEYGGTDGLVTIEDLIEEVVGDIEDEHDEAEDIQISQIDENTFVVDARCELDDLSVALGPDFVPGEHAEDVDTLGGLVTSMLDRVPVRGEVISKLRDFEFEIIQADPRRVKTIKVTRRKRNLRQRPRKLKIESSTQADGTKTAAE
ncbi:hemolysin family protein [Maritalea porphyrae]|jgi:CBS domain containing-hemolysin-like protein|uniref:hemolysin family protein n=1 Tax=Maritalea porphyrae TaxID=880732 RepID=UPI0022AFBEB3|nr:hemolysin family protein [Maritalea porphyrae]MCZ4272186.1 hemolysin family protein [Maritalea porphyrae]